MKRAAIILAQALAACSSGPISDAPGVCPIEPIPDAGATCSFAENQEPLCSATSCSTPGECCAADPSGAHCVAMCEPCCAAANIVDDGVQGYQCTPVAIACEICPDGGGSCEPCEAGGP